MRYFDDTLPTGTEIATWSTTPCEAMSARHRKARLLAVWHDRTMHVMRTNPRARGWWWTSTDDDAELLSVSKSTISRWRSAWTKSGHIETRRQGRILWVRVIPQID